MVPYGGPRGKSSSPNPSSGPPMNLSHSDRGGSSGARRALGGHLTPPSHTGSRSPSPRYVSGWKRSNENSMTPPRGAESDAYRHVGGGLSYPGWLFGSSGTGSADPFPSMWLSALFLHVHPKKQNRALSILVSLQEKSLLRASLVGWQEETAAVQEAIGKQQRAARHYIFGSAFRAMRSWQKRSRDLRVSRMRLRTLVARWLRDMLQKTFGEWKQQRADTRELLTGAERVAERTLFKATTAGFAAWQDIIRAQDHKREVLTRIMLRTQDRAVFKALHSWSAITTHIHRCRLQAERGLSRTKHAMRATAFTAWQDTRQRGLLAMKKMDMAFTRWNRYLMCWSMTTMHEESRRKALVRQRGAWLVHKREQSEVGDALACWSESVVELRSLRKIESAMSLKHARLVKKGAFALWWEGTDERRCLRAAGQRVAYKHERVLERGAWAGWAMVTLSDKACLVACERALAKRDRKMATDAIVSWREEISRAQRLLDLYNRATSRNRRKTLETFWLGWREACNIDAMMRTRGSMAFESGVVRGSRSSGRALLAWRAYATFMGSIEHISRRIYKHDPLMRAMAAWRFEAARLHIQEMRFERLQKDCERRLCRRVLDEWTIAHDRDIGRANRLVKQVTQWDMKCMTRAMDTWVAWWQMHVKAFEMNIVCVRKHGQATCSLGIELWKHAVLHARLLRLKGDRLMASNLLRCAEAAYGGWRQIVINRRILAARAWQISVMSARNATARAWGGWSWCADQTSKRAKAMHKMEARAQTRCVRKVLSAIALMTAEDRSWRQRMANNIARHKSRVVRWGWVSWRRRLELSKDLADLHARVDERTEREHTVGSFEAWRELTVCDRSLAVHALSVVDRCRRNSMLHSFAGWGAHAVRVRKLRSGVQILVIRQQEYLARMAISAWDEYTATRLRNFSIAAASLEKLQHNLRARAFREWDAFSVSEGRKKRGAAALGSRTQNALLHECLLFWRSAAAQCAHGRGTAERMWLTTCASTIGWALNEWVDEATRIKAVRERAERMADKTVRGLITDTFHGWRSQYVLIRSRVEGFDRCQTRQANRAMGVAIMGWFELSCYGKQLRHAAQITEDRAEHAVQTRALQTLAYQLKVNRRLSVLVQHRESREREYVLIGWRAYAVAVERKRTGLQRIMHRWESRTQSDSLLAWFEAAEWIKSSRGRAELVEARRISSSVEQGVATLVRNARASRRYRRMREAFDARWHRHRLRSHFEAWRYWHGKKMAVKGVLDQMVDMM